MRSQNPHHVDYENALAVSVRSKVPVKQQSWSRLLRETGEEYADYCTIDGIRYFAGSNIRFVLVRFSWLLLFIVSFIMGFVIFIPIWRSYMSNAVKDTTEFDAVNEFKLPAFTICNLNGVRRSVVGGSYESYTSFLGTSKHGPDAFKKMCSAVPYFMTEPGLAENRLYYYQLFYNVSTLSSTYGYNGMMLVVPTAYQSVQHCKFKGRTLTDEKCYSSFQNRITSRGYCFTFNPSDAIRNFSLSSLVNAEFSSHYIDSTFPQPLKGMVDFTVKTKGRATAFEMLLNVQQYEYCNAGPNDGVGFELQVHSRDVQPIIPELMDDVIQLSPGKEVTITVGEERVVKETASAGRCSDSVPLDYYKHLKSYQDRNACINECVTKKIKQLCNCLPIFSPAQALADWISTKFNKTFIKTLGDRATMHIVSSVCTSETHNQCVDELIKHLVVDTSLNEQCSFCKLPCFQKKYSVQTTENNFPAQNTFEWYKGLKHPKINYTALRTITGSDLESVVDDLEYIDKWYWDDPESFKNIDEVRQNLLYVRIQVKSMDITVFKETFAVSLSELITQMGGAIGLFTGASILSFAEVFFWFLCPCLARRKPADK